ncbi:MAG: Pantothenate synthetase [Owenweeksia sp. TMED14]|nr:MAG: Pantothenate synthetase [Owenweeksia sp. TMED14]
MKIIDDLNSWNSFKKTVKKGSIIGLVPTMGALHDGHAALIKKAQKECSHVVTSIFINPTQFDNSIDFQNYPSNSEKDIQFLKGLGVTLLFKPSEKLMYPYEIKASNYDLNGLDKKLEGALRPGHFQGVATVVDRLFELLEPDRAYFGLKDFQQVEVVKKVASMRKNPLKIVSCRVVREDSGLAKSSRNFRLSAKQKKAAASIFQALKFAEKEIKIFPIPPIALEREMKSIINSSGFLKVEQIEFVFADNLDLIKSQDYPLDHYQRDVQCFVSAFAGDVRLIDNYRIS